MLTKRIIACLDVHDGRVVKGTRFVNLRDAGNPAELAAAHFNSGADEIVLLDISATHQDRGILLDVVRNTAKRLFIPFCVGGGIRSLEDASAVFDAGADKVSINSAALNDPALITRIANRYGSQAVIVAIDAKRKPDAASFEVWSTGGRKPTGKDAVYWAIQSQELGAGEILLTSMDRDGTKTGFDCELTSAVSSAVRIPVIASGGGGDWQSFVEVFARGKADAALAASIFHFGLCTARELKQKLQSTGIPVRLPC